MLWHRHVAAVRIADRVLDLWHGARPRSRGTGFLRWQTFGMLLDLCCGHDKI